MRGGKENRKRTSDGRDRTELDREELLKARDKDWNELRDERKSWEEKLTKKDKEWEKKVKEASAPKPLTQVQKFWMWYGKCQPVAIIITLAFYEFLTWAHLDRDTIRFFQSESINTLLVGGLTLLMAGVAVSSPMMWALIALVVLGFIVAYTVR